MGPTRDAMLGRVALVLAGTALQVEASGLSACPCINPYTHSTTSGITAVMQNNRVQFTPPGSSTVYSFPSTWGNGCAQHDFGIAPYCDKTTNPQWCAEQWCYVDPDSCEGATYVKARWLKSVSGLYFSYATCKTSGSSKPWDDDSVDATKELLRVTNKYSQDAVKVLEDVWSNEMDRNMNCQVDSGEAVCPCNSCTASSSWDSEIDFFQTGIRQGPAGTSQEKSQSICMAEEVASSYQTVAAEEMDPDFSQVGYSYFAEARTGTYAQYPKEDLCDVDSSWDPRFRPWYAAGATGPKDVLILVDVSGSMSGGRDTKAKAATKRILDTLSWKDFVGVVLFDSGIEAHYSDCLVPATEENVRAIKSWCDNQEWAGGGTNFIDAFHKAFEIIGNSVSSGTTSACQKAVMFLTDGVADFAEDDFNFVKEKATQYDVFVFSYTIGDGAEKTVAKRVACENRGVYYPVPDNGDLESIMARYFDYFTQGQEICTPNFVKYGSATSSVTLYAACSPMYDRTTATRSLLGVSCLDINQLKNIDDMKAQAGWSHFVCQASDITKTCRSLDLSECHRQRVRLSYSSESVCEDQEPVTTDTACPCQDPSCQDDPNWRDEKKYFCDNWIGDACTEEAAKQWGYSSSGIQQVKEKCKRSCGLCAWAACPSTVAGECETISVASECRACLGKTSGVDIEGNTMACPAGSPQNLMAEDPPVSATCASAARRTEGMLSYTLALILGSWGFVRALLA